MKTAVVELSQAELYMIKDRMQEYAAKCMTARAREGANGRHAEYYRAQEERADLLAKRATDALLTMDEIVPL
jgi:hypothetical protein